MGDLLYIIGKTIDVLPHIPTELNVLQYYEYLCNRHTVSHYFSTDFVKKKRYFIIIVVISERTSYQYDSRETSHPMRGGSSGKSESSIEKIDKKVIKLTV